MSFCMYYLTRGNENLKLLKRDAIDILFWLTMYDTLGLNDLILRNVARAMRSFSIGKEETILLLKQERFFTVLKTLSKSKNEDVLWQTAGLIYNVMQVESCLKKFLERGLVNYIFDLAGSGFSHVKHVCSACLHMIPEHIPNMDDPLSLELVLCLLEAEGDKFGEISQKPIDNLNFPMDSCNKDSNFVINSTNFMSSWAPFTCLVENFFTPALIYTEGADQHDGETNSYTAALTTSIDVTSITTTDKHKKLKGKDYDDFQQVGGVGTNNPTDHFPDPVVPPPVVSGAGAAASSSQHNAYHDDYEYHAASYDHGISSKEFEKRPPNLMMSSFDPQQQHFYGNDPYSSSSGYNRPSSKNDPSLNRSLSRSRDGGTGAASRVVTPSTAGSGVLKKGLTEKRLNRNQSLPKISHATNHPINTVDAINSAMKLPTPLSASGHHSCSHSRGKSGGTGGMNVSASQPVLPSSLSYNSIASKKNSLY
jgi:hypothetical protein